MALAKWLRMIAQDFHPAVIERSGRVIGETKHKRNNAYGPVQ
jgi:hypothetical protein